MPAPVARDDVYVGIRGGRTGPFRDGEVVVDVTSVVFVVAGITLVGGVADVEVPVHGC